ncbi:MAG: HAD family hydrolase [Candidatus Nanoarchaeia archaeon]
MVLLIFDLDDTLYKSRSLTKEVEKKIAAKYKDVANLPDDVDAISEFRRVRRERALSGKKTSATHIFGDHGVKREDFFQLLDSIDPRDHVEYDKKTHKMIKDLAEEHTLVLFSNSPRIRVDKTLEALKLASYFTKIFGADDWHKSKPDPGIFKMIMEETGFRPEDTISIGDDVYKEILPSKNAGIKTVLVCQWPYTDEEKAQADCVIGHIHELPEAVKSFINK